MTLWHVKPPWHFVGEAPGLPDSADSEIKEKSQAGNLNLNLVRVTVKNPLSQSVTAVEDDFLFFLRTISVERVGECRVGERLFSFRYARI